MPFITLEQLDDKLWPLAKALYDQAFAIEGRKADSILTGMFAKKMCQLQLAVDGDEVTAMAITGITGEGKLLIIDYIAVREDLRGNQIGRSFVNAIKLWAQQEKGLQGIVIEVESEDTPVNKKRIRFWERCGFTLMDYVHQYIWVPEPYQAMYLRLDAAAAWPDNERKLFRTIEAFHNRAYSKL